MRRFFVPCAALLVCGLGAQAGAQQPAGDSATATLRVQSRLVIEDVVVMDGKGNPVHGLPASAFHILDNGVPQQLRDFDEGSPKPADQPATAPLPAGTFSNAVQGGLAPTTEVLLIDTDDMELLDQMFLLKQLQKAIASIPADLPAAMFGVRNGRVVPILSATTDRAAMMHAAEEILPVQNHAIESRFQSAVNQLMTVAAFLQQTPGRKNLIWFAGAFPLVTVSGGEEVPGGLQVNYSERENVIHQVQEALAEARISVYPVDIRGVIPDSTAVPDSGDGGGSSAASGRNPSAANAASQKREVAGPGSASVADERSEMRALAAATGGRAYMLNSLAVEIDNAFDLGKSAYTLGYSPSPYSTDQSFHRVTVQVDGGYTVSYRKGYLATWTGGADNDPRMRLTAGTKQRIDPNQNTPLLFQAQLLPQVDAQHVLVSFTIPVGQLAMQPSSGSYFNTLIVSTYAYDASGRVKDGRMQELNTKLTSEQYAQAKDANKKVGAKETLTVAKGAKYLVLIVRDKQSQRTGSLLLQTRILDSLPKQGEAKTAVAEHVSGPSAFGAAQESSR